MRAASDGRIRETCRDHVYVTGSCWYGTFCIWDSFFRHPCGTVQGNVPYSSRIAAAMLHHDCCITTQQGLCAYGVQPRGDLVPAWSSHSESTGMGEVEV